MIFSSHIECVFTFLNALEKEYCEMWKVYMLWVLYFTLHNVVFHYVPLIMIDALKKYLAAA